LAKKGPDNVIFGRHPVVEAIQSGVAFDKLILQQGVRGDFEKEIRQLSREFDIPLQVAPKERLRKWTTANHQGIIGLQSLISYQSLEQLLPYLYERSEMPLLVILDGVTDVRNLGAIARSAECVGAHGIIIPKKGSALINGEAIKTSAGALNRISVCRESSLINAIELLQQSGLRVLVSDLQAEKPIYKLDMRGPVALVVGSEDTGISQGVADRADERFIIPQQGDTDSFNVSVAAGIMLYEVLRQRLTAHA
jgi:23S rRNA (guanosine2251-2'-O)-methyltransferase